MTEFESRLLVLHQRSLEATQTLTEKLANTNGELVNTTGQLAATNARQTDVISEQSNTIATQSSTIASLCGNGIGGASTTTVTATPAASMPANIVDPSPALPRELFETLPSDSSPLVNTKSDDDDDDKNKKPAARAVVAGTPETVPDTTASLPHTIDPTPVASRPVPTTGKKPKSTRKKPEGAGDDPRPVLVVNPRPINKDYRGKTGMWRFGNWVKLDDPAVTTKVRFKKYELKFLDEPEEDTT